MREHGHDRGFSWYDGAGHAHDGWWSGPLHLLAALAVVALIVVGVVWLVRRYGHHVAPQVAAPTPAVAASAPAAADPAIGTLRLRYAQGEVSREEYLTRMTDLTGGTAPSDATSAAATEPWPGGAAAEAPTDERPAGEGAPPA